jgi:hypothetical protein
MIDQLFIIPYARAMNEREEQTLLNHLRDFFTSWESHGRNLKAAAEIAEKRFLIIKDFGSESSGCSKDRLFREIETIHQKIGLQQADSALFFVESDGEILGLKRKELIQMLENKKLGKANLLFPTWISDSEGFQNLWKKPLQNFPQLLPGKDLV